MYQIETIFSEGTPPVRPFNTKYNQMKTNAKLVLNPMYACFFLHRSGCGLQHSDVGNDGMYQ
ncbi:hypothetical protein [Prevotella histicola]|uniref:hypothetical protein n=1 Tax=Prevotella histicola TaxID=470565 RepID=UPI00215184D8|nr:hypothetical protein [Prevotella histicola]